MPEPLLTAELTNDLESLHIEILSAYAEAAQQQHPEFAPTLLKVGSGVAVFAGEGSPLTQVYALKLANEDFDAIGGFYAGRAANWELTIGPFTDKDTMRRVCERGYTLSHFETSMIGVDVAGSAGILPAEVGASAALVKKVPDDSPEFRSTLYKAWVGEQAEGDFDDVTDLMARLPGADLYLATIDDEPAGGGTMYRTDRYAVLMGAGVREPFRNRGVQTALLQKRMQDAGNRIPLVTTTAGTTSYRNAQRAGFQALFSYASFVRKHE